MSTFVPEYLVSNVHVPLPLGKGQNDRHGHWAKKHKQATGEREALAWMLAGKTRPRLPAVVLLTRISPSAKGLDGDNLQGAFKAVRDEVAGWLKVDDGDTARITFRYAQRTGPWGFEVALFERGDRGADAKPE